MPNLSVTIRNFFVAVCVVCVSDLAVQHADTGGAADGGQVHSMQHQAESKQIASPLSKQAAVQPQLDAPRMVHDERLIDSNSLQAQLKVREPVITC